MYLVFSKVLKKVTLLWEASRIFLARTRGLNLWQRPREGPLQVQVFYSKISLTLRSTFERLIMRGSCDWSVQTVRIKLWVAQCGSNSRSRSQQGWRRANTRVLREQVELLINKDLFLSGTPGSGFEFASLQSKNIAFRKCMLNF